MSCCPLVDTTTGGIDDLWNTTLRSDRLDGSNRIVHDLTYVLFVGQA